MIKRDLCNSLEENFGNIAEIDFQPMQQGDVPESFAEINKSVEMLGYKPATNVDVGIRKFIDWYKTYHTLI